MTENGHGSGLLHDPEGRGVCSSCGQAFDRLNSHSCAGDGALASSPDLMIGKFVAGKYEIDSLIGQGGMSVVYKARQFPINKIVALKMLMAHLSNDEASVRRFLQEARAAGQISHPNVVNVTDFGISENRQAYLVMDYLEGETLAQALARRGPLAWPDAIKIFLEICDGLAVAHEHGVIHRDIKPGNIVLQDVSGVRRVRLVDFGIAKMIDAESQHLTRTGEVFGSPLYMSPEQCEGRPLDLRSDIYSLGVVFYEVLCAYPPLAGQSALETMRLHMSEMPESLQRAELELPVPLALENIIFKMLAKDREKRYSNMLEVRRELEQVLSGEVNQLSGNLQHMGREISRKSKLITVSTGVFLVLVVAGVLVYPGACAALAKHQYEQGKTEFQKGAFDAAAPFLVSSVDFSRKANDVAAENRSLGLLVEVYRKTGNQSLLKETRRRRQEIIKAELSRLDIDNIDLDSALAMGADAVPADESKKLPQNKISLASDEISGSSSSYNDTQKASPSHSTGDGATLADEEAPTVSDKRASNAQEPLPSSMPQAAISSRRKKTDLILSMTPTPMLQGATNGTIGPPADSFGNEAKQDKGVNVRGRLANRISQDQNKSVQLVQNTANKETPASKYGESYFDESSYGKSLPAGAGGASGGAGGASAGFTYSSNRAAFAGGRGALNALRRAAASTASASPSPSPISNTAFQASPEKLDRLKALTDIFIEHGRFAKARQCAGNAIRMSLRLNEQDSELAHLYCQSAWAKIKLGELNGAMKDIALAVSSAKSSNSQPELAEATALQALAYLESGNKEMALSSFKQAEDLSRGNESGLFQQLKDKYRERVK